MKILVTGGPVHAYLDPVKMITNRFKGGMMTQIAERLNMNLHADVEVTYLCTKDVVPNNVDWIGGKVVHHDGFDDYMDKVLELAPEMDAVVLGAAVANLIPLHPFKKKFPSHKYKPGDVIPIDFTIAPRVIDRVKAVMKPGAHLFGFKLLAGQPHEELIEAAYEILRESGATAVFANDASSKDSLLTKYAVTKERAVHEMTLDDVPDFILKMVDDKYYRTKSQSFDSQPDGDEEYRTQTDPKKPLWQRHVDEAMERASELIKQADAEGSFVKTEDGYVFGTVAVKVLGHGGEGFITTGRGKRECDDLVYVRSVDHLSKAVYVHNGKKATLNAPLLDRIIKERECVVVLHFHRQEPGLPTQEYAPPGTDRDTRRDVSTSFNVADHGCFILLDEEGNRI